MRVGIIGLGDIAQKAYLPVITKRENTELVLCTRNRNTLDRLATKYRIREAAEHVDKLIEAGIDAAFVHSSTESHAAIAERLIRSGIPVYVDKPISYHYAQSERLAELASKEGVPLMVGFNRRFAPMYAALKEQANLRLVTLQKNRIALPEFARRFVLDDFIHVVDTLRYLAPGRITDSRVSSYVQDGKLHHVTVQLYGDGFTCTGVMNRDSGANDEILEAMNPGNKWVVDGVNAVVHFKGGEERHLKFNDWDPLLYRRGFTQIIDHFLSCVEEKRSPDISLEDALETHQLCETIIKQAEENGALPWDKK